MKKFLSAGLLALAMTPAAALADVTVKLPKDINPDSITYDYTTIQNLVNAKNRSERNTVKAAAAVKNDTAIIPIGTDQSGYSINIFFSENAGTTIYVAPDDEITLEVISTDPENYRISGTDLTEGMNQLETISQPFINKINAIKNSDNPDREQMQSIYNDYLESLKDYIKENPTYPASCVAILRLSGEDFLNSYSLLGERAKSSIVFPLVEKQKERVTKSVEKERKQAQLSSGNVDAPAITLKDLEGKEVSLSDFKGKWVIIDFWGTWCPWCIKGFPELKEAFEKYKDELVIFGVDCGDSEEAWKKGVEKYELPWVNVYNPEGSSVLDDYAVQGFPTKAIVNPEGKIANITVGHDPAFFEKLTELMGK